MGRIYTEEEKNEALRISKKVWDYLGKQDVTMDEGINVLILCIVNCLMKTKATESDMDRLLIYTKSVFLTQRGEC